MVKPKTTIRRNAECISLVPATAEHAPLLYAIFTGAGTQKYSPVSPTSVAELADRLRRNGTSFSEHAPFYRFFGSFEENLFGSFVAKNIDRKERSAEIGFSLLDAWQGRGLGTALVYKCVEKTFKESEFERLWATVSVTNDACNRLMRRLGFADCGLYHETFLIQGEPVRQTLYQMERGEAPV